MTFEVDLCKRLRNLRETRSLSRREIERQTKGRIKASTLAMYEHGARRIPTPKLKYLADFYGVPISFLVGESAPSGAQYDLEAILLSDPGYSEEERDLLLHVISIIKAKRRAEGRS